MSRCVNAVGSHTEYIQKAIINQFGLKKLAPLSRQCWCLCKALRSMDLPSGVLACMEKNLS